MKLILALLMALSQVAPGITGEYQPGYSSSKTCTRNEYREEYFPGTQSSPGYVKSWTETIDVPCDSSVSGRKSLPSHQVIDNNDCSEGTILGSLLGAGIAGRISRGKDRWLAVPAGEVGGAMIGCQMDGG